MRILPISLNHIKQEQFWLDCSYELSLSFKLFGEIVGDLKELV